jgi:hypothetical protein
MPLVYSGLLAEIVAAFYHLEKQPAIHSYFPLNTVIYESPTPTLFSDAYFLIYDLLKGVVSSSDYTMSNVG